MLNSPGVGATDGRELLHTEWGSRTRNVVLWRNCRHALLLGCLCGLSGVRLRSPSGKELLNLGRYPGLTFRHGKGSFALRKCEWTG